MQPSAHRQPARLLHARLPWFRWAGAGAPTAADTGAFPASP